MSVTYAYLNDMRTAVRRSPSPAVDREVSELIEMCRADMVGKGVPEETAVDETDMRVKAVIRLYLRWQFGTGGDDQDRIGQEYRIMLDELRKRDDSEDDEEETE